METLVSSKNIVSTTMGSAKENWGHKPVPDWASLVHLIKGCGSGLALQCKLLECSDTARSCLLLSPQCLMKAK